MINSSSLKKFNAKTFLVTTLLLTSFAAIAQDDNNADSSGGGGCCNGLVAAVNNVESAVSTGFETTIKTINDLVSNIVDFTSTITTSNLLNTTTDWSNEDSSQKLNEITKTAFTNSPEQNRNVILSGYTKVPLSADNNADSKINYFTYSSLANTPSLDENKQKVADQYIQYVSQLTTPIEPLDVARIDPKNPTPYAQLFQNALGSYMATQSIALDTFYKMLADRTPQTGLGEAIGKGPNSKASPLELQEYRVNSHLESKWMQEMVKANPADVQKQMLFILANIEYLLFQNKMQLEQLNATNAALLLQNQTGLDRKTLGDYRSKASE